MCRPIDHAYWFLSEPLLDVSTSCPLTEMWERVCLTLPSVTVSFLIPRKKTAPPESVERDACVRQQVVPQHWHKCYDTLLCKCQSHPIKWLSDAIAHKGIPPIKFSVCYQLCFLVFPSFPETLYRQECCSYTPLQYIQWQRRPMSCYSTTFHAAGASCCFCDSLGSSLCLLFICKQFWPPTHWLYLQQCQSVVCSVDFTLIIGCSTCCQAPTLSCSVTVMKFILAVQEQPTVTGFSLRCLKID